MKASAKQIVVPETVEAISENLKPFEAEGQVQGQASIEAAEPTEIVESSDPIEEPAPLAETFSLSISLNKEQLLAKDLAFNGKSFCLIGAAGTGKTTAQREVASELLRQNKLGTHTFRIQGSAERMPAPSIAFVAYTRIASGNLRRAIHKDPALEAALTHNITTIHNLLEYTPETYYDYEANEEKFRFVPRRTASNQLDLTHLIIEESSMVGLDLWEKLFDALRPDTQIIFIGDINQLPPVFGPSILNYALVQLPIVELTTVYRQAGDSSILLNAHKILAGDSNLLYDNGTKIIRGGTVQHSQAKLAQSIGMMVPKWRAAGEYDPDQDIFLSPWNKQDLGTDNLNKLIAQHIGDERKAVVFEIICGIAKIYLAVGDKVLFNKQVGYVKQIRRNLSYVGKSPKQESENLTRFGSYRANLEEPEDDFMLAGYENISLEEILEQEQGEKKRQSSHIVELDMETGITETLSAVGDFSPATFSLGYCLTVHKAQGCEWRKVYFILHKDHSISAYRELLYTATTRAREQLCFIAKDAMIQKAIATQRIKGNTLAEKIEYFNSGLLNQEDVKCTK
jgi:exodeoxyribonuclease V alpha subunit